VEQWWECKFIGEGIIDQGGGFRDSLSDIAEELCPNTSLDSPVPLPFFIRSPNQVFFLIPLFSKNFKSEF
jgi:E3 ubiquitin-protein ligase HECTD3